MYDETGDGAFGTNNSGMSQDSGDLRQEPASIPQADGDDRPVECVTRPTLNDCRHHPGVVPTRPWLDKRNNGRRPFL